MSDVDDLLADARSTTQEAREAAERPPGERPKPSLEDAPLDLRAMAEVILAMGANVNSTNDKINEAVDALTSLPKQFRDAIKEGNQEMLAEHLSRTRALDEREVKLKNGEAALKKAHGENEATRKQEHDSSEEVKKIYEDEYNERIATVESREKKVKKKLAFAWFCFTGIVGGSVLMALFLVATDSNISNKLDKAIAKESEAEAKIIEAEKAIEGANKTAGIARYIATVEKNNDYIDIRFKQEFGHTMARCNDPSTNLCVRLLR